MLDALGSAENGHVAGERRVLRRGAERLRGGGDNNAVGAGGRGVDGAHADRGGQLEAGQAGKTAVAVDAGRLLGGTGQERDLGATLRKEMREGQAPRGRACYDEG